MSKISREMTVYSLRELFDLVEEYFITHPERDGREHVDTNSPAQTYHEGAVDFLRWLGNGKEFLYEQETYEDMHVEDLEFLLSIGAADNLFRKLDGDEEENCERDETY